MLKIMIIKYQQFAKMNTFSLSFQIPFFPFLPKTHENQDLGMGKNGVGPPDCQIKDLDYITSAIIKLTQKCSKNYHHK